MPSKKWIIPVMYGLACLFSFYVVLQYIVYKPSQAGAVSAKLGDPSFPYEVWKLFFYPHIILGLIALLVGAYQLTPRSRRNPKLHKKLGRVYGLSILLNVLAVPYIALYATGGRPSTIAFLVMDVLWLATTANGIRHILRRDAARHREWMLRSYAVTFLFVTFRILMLAMELTTHAPPSVVFPTCVYLSIALNLLFAEAYLRQRGRRNAAVEVQR